MDVTLGKVERVSPDSMAVRLDDGRQVAFDLKDYAHVDHGSAATIHKSQGVTVAQGHVLATPGMDRHAAYVALSRHREGVQPQDRTTVVEGKSVSASLDLGGRRHIKKT